MRDILFKIYKHEPVDLKYSTKLYQKML